MTLRRLCFSLLFCFASTAWSADGLVAVKSHYAPKETIDRLEKLVKEKGMTVFARVDHAAGASKVGKTLRPTELLIFGNPQGGTPPKCTAAANLKKAVASFVGAAAAR